MQITDLVRDSPLRDLGTILSQCIHVVVPRDEQDSFEYDPEEKVDIERRKMEIVMSQMKIMFQRVGQEGWVSQMGRG